jgi:hypothetical protein
MRNERRVTKVVLSLSLVFAIPGSGADKGPTDRLADQADAIVAGAVQSGRQNGQFVSFVLTVDRTIKGNIPTGAKLTVSWKSPWALNRDLGGNYGLWFLARHSDGSWELLPARQSRAPFELTFFHLSPTNSPSSANAITTSTASSQIASELLTAMQHYQDRDQLLDLGTGLFGIADPVVKASAFRALSASPDPELKYLGLAGLVKSNEASALSELVKGASVIPKLRTRQFALGVIGSMQTGDLNTIQALGSFAASTDPVMRRSAASALCNIHTQDTLSYLAMLLDSTDRETLEYAIRGLSRFVNNLPITAAECVPSLKCLVPQGPAPYKTLDTDRYSLSTRAMDPTQESAYVLFWKSWWLRVKDQVTSK